MPTRPEAIRRLAEQALVLAWSNRNETQSLATAAEQVLRESGMSPEKAIDLMISKLKGNPEMMRELAEHFLDRPNDLERVALGVLGYLDGKVQ